MSKRRRCVCSRVAKTIYELKKALPKEIVAVRHMPPGTGEKAAVRHMPPGTGEKAAVRHMPPGTGEKAAVRHMPPGTGEKAAVRHMPPGTGEKGATKIKAEYEKVKFLTWLGDYMYEEKSKSLVTTMEQAFLFDL